MKMEIYHFLQMTVAIQKQKMQNAGHFSFSLNYRLKPCSQNSGQFGDTYSFEPRLFQMPYSLNCLQKLTCCLKKREKYSIAAPMAKGKAINMFMELCLIPVSFQCTLIHWLIHVTPNIHTNTLLVHTFKQMTNTNCFLHPVQYGFTFLYFNQGLVLNIQKQKDTQRSRTHF